jgi:adenylate kinase
MRLVLVGPPGSGKGTQAELLRDRLGLTEIGTGDILRAAIKKGSHPELKAILGQGRLAPDEVVNQLVGELFRSEQRPHCFVMDGYPRTLAQAKWFDNLLKESGTKLDGVIEFGLNDDDVVHRISGRWSCPRRDCKALYHTISKPPKVAGICDNDGEKLIQRDDDRESVIRERLQVFHDNYDALVAYYKVTGLLHVIPALGSPEAIYSQTVNYIQSLRKAG